MKNRANEKMLRYVYIISLDNRGSKSQFYGLRKAYYVGQTNDIQRRFLEHLRGINSDWINRNFRYARKTLEYIEYIYGTEDDAVKREKQLKGKNREQKEKLIYSNENKLIRYIPCKCIVLKRMNEEGECAIKL